MKNVALENKLKVKTKSINTCLQYSKIAGFYEIGLKIFENNQGNIF
jgi:hypothetical protein